MTDEYWIHGGTLENIAVTIANGVPEKAMPTWQTQLSKKDVLMVASYIKSLKGTNPPNAKPPQGDLYKGD
jgi:cytochrome c oxidase cbb3-type subunit 3